MLEFESELLQSASAMDRYSDLIDRIFLDDDLLKVLTPSDISNRDLWRRLRDADDATLAGGRPIGDPAAFKLVRGGVLYAVDDLDGAHRIFQDCPGDVASYWHALMHRREGDFDNARYWFNRAGTLPVFNAMHAAAANKSPDMAKQPNWDPSLMNHQCEQAAHGDPDLIPELAALQKVEWEVLFDYCWRQAKVG
jgi:hypothetical protein